MLYLILPPIIIVVTLIFLVYFFSRRFSQVNDVLKEESLDFNAPDLSDTGVFMPIKSASIRIMERVVGWFKDITHSAHGKLQVLSSDVKEKKEKSTQQMKNTLQQVQAARAARQEKKMARDESVKSTRLKEVEEDGKEIRSEKVASVEIEKSTDIARVTSTDGVRVGTKNARFQALKNVVSKVRELPKKSEERIARMRPTVSQQVMQPEVVITEEDPVEEETVETKDQLEDILVERIAANPRDLEAYERLGEYYMEQGNVQDAKECYRQVLRLSPVHRLAKIKIRRLEKMLEQK